MTTATIRVIQTLNIGFETACTKIVQKCMNCGVNPSKDDTARDEVTNDSTLFGLYESPVIHKYIARAMHPPNMMKAKLKESGVKKNSTRGNRTNASTRENRWDPREVW